MTYNQSLVAITPAAFRPTAEALGQAMGHSGSEFNVPLYTDASGEPTHYGLHAWATPEVAAIWLGEAYPPDTGYTDEQIDAVRAQLIISVQQDAVPVTHFESVLAANSLTRNQSEI